MKRRLSFTSKLTVGALLGVAALLLAPQSSADTVFKKDGGKIRGTIVEENSAYVKIKAYGSVYTIKRRDIQRVERDGDSSNEFQKRKRKLKSHDDKGWLELGFWCQDNDFLPESIDCFYKVLEINPDNAEAHYELGHRKLRGQWVPAREYFAAKGYVRYQGMWVTKGDKEKYEAGLVKDGEEWITREEWERRAEKRKDGDLFGGNSGSAPRAAPPVPEPEPARPTPRKRARPPAANPFNPRRRLPGGPPAQDVPESPEERKAKVDQLKASGPWKHAHMSKYYNFFSNGPIDETKTLASTMDKACVTFKKIFDYKPEIVRSFPIFMYASQQEFQQRTGRGQGVGGYYTSQGQIFSFHSRRAQGTLLHEGTHQFQGLALGRNMWSAKIWFIEGLAVYFEGSKVRKKDLDTSPIPKDRLAHVKRSISSKNHIPIATLIRMEQAEFGAVHYAHAWSLIYFFVNGTKGGRERFKQYFEGVKEGRDGLKMFEEIFNKPIPVIEKAWLEYIKKLTPKG